nr:MAG TPA: hypothetical protein [Caudoviricetes sp.]
MRIDISTDNSADSKATFIYLMHEKDCAMIELFEFTDSVYVYVYDFSKNFSKTAFENVNLAKAYIFELVKELIIY